MIGQFVEKASKGENLSRKEAREAFDLIMAGKVETPEIKELLIALRDKGETIDEISGAAESMKDVVANVSPKTDKPLLDIVGTGGDCKSTINVSTASAFVAAGAGCIVAKHGNRSVSSKCGSADVLEKLGVKLECGNEKNTRMIEKIGIAFLFAPCHHPAMKFAIPARKEIGTRTIFNILGPLTNPANAQTFLLGIFSLELAENLAGVLANLKIGHALVVHGNDGFDEISVSDATTVFEVKGGKIERYEISPEQFGFQRANERDIKVSSIEENATVLKAILSGKEKDAKRDIVVFNAGAAIYVNNLASSIGEGIEKARQSIDSGSALKKLEQLVEESGK